MLKIKTNTQGRFNIDIIKRYQNMIPDSYISTLNQFKKFLDAAYRKKLNKKKLIKVSLIIMIISYKNNY